MATAKQQARWRERDKLRQRGLEEVRGIWLPPHLHDDLREIAQEWHERDNERPA